MDLHLNNKTALVTGASKGIGKATAESLAQEGCYLVITARSDDKLIQLKTNLQKQHDILGRIRCRRKHTMATIL